MTKALTVDDLRMMRDVLRANNSGPPEYGVLSRAAWRMMIIETCMPNIYETIRVLYNQGYRGRELDPTWRAR